MLFLFLRFLRNDTAGLSKMYRKIFFKYQGNNFNINDAVFLVYTRNLQSRLSSYQFRIPIRLFEID